MRLSSLFILILALSFSCKQKEAGISGNDDHRQKITTGALSAADRLSILRNEQMILSTLYHQNAAEYRALCYQAFNLGRFMLEKDLADKSIDKHRIIVLDVDETVLDNSPFQAKCILEGTTYPKYWDEWCMLANAKALPGAVDFLKYAEANGVSIFYVTNRKAHLKEPTLKNLSALGFPDADQEHLIMRTSVDSKEPRRQELLKKYHISLLFGDNLNDFSNVFEKRETSSRASEADRLWESFGTKFVVLPNAMYGDWELALYGYDSKIHDTVKYEMRRKALRAF